MKRFIASTMIALSMFCATDGNTSDKKDNEAKKPKIIIINPKGPIIGPKTTVIY